MGNCITRLKWSSRYPDITSEVIEKLQLTPLNKDIINTTVCAYYEKNGYKYI